MTIDRADCGTIAERLMQLGEYLDRYQRFEHADAMQQPERWRDALNRTVPAQGIGIDGVMKEMGETLIPNGSQIPNPGCTSFITTGASNIGVLATLAGTVASPQRLGLTAFNYLEELSLQWLAEMFGLADNMKGVYSSGGSVANLVALGAARQWAFERRSIDPARDGITRACRIYATRACHHTVHRAAAVLGMGRAAVVTVASDADGRMLPDALLEHIRKYLN